MILTTEQAQSLLRLHENLHKQVDFIFFRSHYFQSRNRLVWQLLAEIETDFLETIFFFFKFWSNNITTFASVSETRVARYLI